MSQLKIYWKNGGEIKELLHSEKAEEEKKEETKYFSASEIISFKRRNQKSYGKYIDAI